MIARFVAQTMSFNKDNKFVEICPIGLEVFNSFVFVACVWDKKKKLMGQKNETLFY
jgi:hypothetical protein